jgi:malate synthase
VPGGQVTEAGIRQNVSVAIRYLDAWLQGNGAAAIDNLMEDTATAEISRSQLWQWRRHSTPLGDGVPFTRNATGGSATRRSSGWAATPGE